MLLSKVTEGGLSPSEGAKLAEFIQRDQSFRDLYLAYCQMHAMLRDEHGLLASWGVPDEIPPAERPGPRMATRSRLVVWALAVAVSISLVAVGHYIVSDAVVSDSDGPQVPPYRGHEVALLKNQVGLRFAYGADGEPRMAEGSPMPRGRYELQSGVVEIAFPAGAVLTIEAPAVFELVSEEHVALENGKLSAHVPQEARGFTIDTPGGLVVDLGTEFAIEARREQESEVHVFSGEVQIKLRGSKVATADPLHLIAGEAAKIDFLTGVPAGIDLDEQRFLRRLNVEPTAYAQHVLKLNPAVYYPMEPIDDGVTLVDASASGADAIVYLGRARGPVWSAGKVGAAFELGGPSQQTYASAARYPQTRGDELSVVAWVRADARPRWATIAKNWAGARDRGQFHFGLYFDSGELEAHIQDSSGEEIFVKDKQPLPLNDWHHVAFVADGKNLRLYRNGKQVDVAAYHRLYRNPQLRALGIGTKLNLRGDAPEDEDYSMWDGRLDELAIFNYALAPDDVRELYRLASEGN